MADKILNRKLVREDQFLNLTSRLEEIGKMINGYIKSIGDVNEPDSDYETKSNRYESLPNP